MPRKIYEPEEIIAKLRQAELLILQGKSAVDAIRAIAVTDARLTIEVAVEDE
jgi:putative transposase